jgi:hypothetical protein
MIDLAQNGCPCITHTLVVDEVSFTLYYVKRFESLSW